MATTTATQIQQLYVGLLGRAADKSGLDWWVDQVTTGGRTLEDIRASFVTSTEYTTTYGAAATRAELVTSIYQNLFERTPSADEVKYWAETDTRPADQLVAAFIEFGSANDQKVIANKVFVAQTYTDTVGTSFTAAGAASVIANVDGTVASVNTAIGTIANGTAGGLVPGVALINSVATALDAKVAYAATAGAANPTLDKTLASGAAGKDGLVSFAEATTALGLANSARTGEPTATSTATSSLSNENTNLSLAKIGVSATAISNYDAAVATQKSLTVGFSASAAVIGSGDATKPEFPAQTALQNATTAATTAKATALTSLDTALTAAGSAVTYTTLGTAVSAATGTTVTYANKAALQSALETATGVTKTTLATELAKVATFGTPAVDAVNKVISLSTAASTVNTAETAVGANYVNAAKAQATAADLVTKVTALDAAVTAAKTVVDQYNVLDANINTAKANLAAFGSANTDKVTLSDVSGTAVDTVLQATTKSDVFYFGNAKVATNDFSIGGTTNFAAGDSIVIGSGYTFNSGALSTGNANTLEFFLVKGATGTQVVIETEAFGNSSTVVGTDGTVAASPNATVINLVGVTADHLQVANGVVSYV